MVWWIVGLCLLLVLLALLLLSWLLFRTLFGRKKAPVKALGAGVNHGLDQIRAALGETRAWMEAQGPEKLELRARDGTRLRAWLLYAPEETKSFVIGVHGFKSSKLSDIALSAPFYHAQGKNLLLVDDRAHGESEGKYTGFAWLDRLDVLDWCAYLLKRFGPETKILLHGVSMGATAVCCAAGERELPRQVLGVVSDCAFSSAWAELKYAARHLLHLPAFPLLPLVNFWLRLRAGYSLRACRAVEQVEKANVPFLFFHGEADELVPPEMARALWAACRTEKHLHLVPGAGHAMCWLADSPGCQARIQEFMEALGF